MSGTEEQEEFLPEVPEAELPDGPARVKRELTTIAKSGRPVVVGPFLSELGFEVLYWVPMLAWAAERFGLTPDRLTAVSRGGAAPWYAGLAGRYVDVLDVVDQPELKRANEARVARFRTQKQLEPLPQEIEMAQRASGDGDAVLLHPSTMYQLFMPFWRGRAGVSLVEKRTRFRPLTAPAPAAVTDQLAGLPERFVAVKFYSSVLFPADDERREFVRELVDRLSRRCDVVVLGAPVDVDDHEDFPLDGPRVHRLPSTMRPVDNLAVQTEVLRRAGAFYSTFGGFAHLAPFLGTRTLAFTAASRCLPHVDVMGRAVRELRRQGLTTGFGLLNPEDLPLLELLGPA